MELHGIHVPLVTPFDARGRIAADALEALADQVLAEGAAGLVALGTTAEAAALDPAERALVVEVCARACRRHRAPLTVGTGGGDTRAVADALAALAATPEVTAALVAVPAFARPGPDGVLAHFAHLAASSPVPLVGYHVPPRTGQPLTAAALRALAGTDGVAGVKYATGVLDAGVLDLLADPVPGFAVLAGDDRFASPMLALGAAGGVLASAHLRTRDHAELAGAWRAGDAGRARELGHRLQRLAEAAFAEPNPAVIKGALHVRGRIPTPDVRLPLLNASPGAVGELLGRC
jgi:4-hydroxy-tetrahydrodipicolinate synthase